MGDQKREAGADVEESVVFGDHDRVLEFDGRHLLASGLDALGHAELWQGPTPAGNGDGARGESGAVSEDTGWVGV